MLHDAVSLAVNPPEIVWLDRDDDPNSPGPSNGRRDRLIFCHYPSPALLDQIASGRMATVAFLDDPHDCIRYHRRVSGDSFLDALRAQSLAHAFIPSVAESHDATIISRTPSGDAGPLIKAVLDRLALTLQPAQLDGLLERQGGGTGSLEDALARAAGQNYQPPGSWTPTEVERRLVDQVLGPLLALGTGRAASWSDGAEEIYWSPDLFMMGDSPDEPPLKVIDVTGGARVIVFGPYMFLPPGSYDLTWQVALSSDLRGLPFEVSCVSGPGLTPLGKIRFEALSGGAFASTLRIRHTLSKDYLQILIRTERGAIQGRIALLGVRVRPVAQGGLGTYVDGEFADYER